MDDLIRFVKVLSHWQHLSPLSQVLVKITFPGIPDFYQGTELWDYSLVDPGNRRKVDYTQRASYLNYLKNQDRERLVEKMLKNMENGLVKLFLIHRALGVRRMYLDTFTKGDFIPLGVSGKFKANIIAFVRDWQGRCIATIALRFFTRLVGPGKLFLGRKVFKDTQVDLPFGSAENLIPGKTAQSSFTGDILSDFPVALLLGKGA